MIPQSMQPPSLGGEKRRGGGSLLYCRGTGTGKSDTGGRASLTPPHAEAVLGGPAEWTGAAGDGHKGPPSLPTPHPLVLGLTKPARDYVDGSRSR